MLLEVLSDFQISIPELGVIEARTHPIVVLTSNNSRELTEALKRRCLYLWLDYPEVEREMEIVRLHAPELDEKLARRLVEVIHMVRALDLKKPPSIAESIDWARALLLLGADDIDRALFERTMSIIVKHRTDIDLVAERVGVQLGEDGQGSTWPSGILTRAALPPGLAPRLARLLRGAAQRGRRGRHLRDPRRLRGARRGAVDRAGRLPRGARGDDRQVAGGPARLRAALRPLLLPRRRGRGARAAGSARTGATRAASGSTSTQLREAIRAGDRRGLRRRDARPRPARDRRLRPPGRGLGRGRRRRAADPPHAGPAGRQPRRRRRRAASSTASRSSALRAPPAPRARAGADRAHREAAAVAAARRARPGAADQPDPGPRRGPPRRRPAQAPAGDARPRAARAQARGDRRHAPDDARLAGDRRRAAAAQVPAEAPAPAGDLRALRRLDLGHLGERLLPLGPARAPRLVPQAAQLRLHRADLRGHRGLRARARLPRDLAEDQPARAASPTSPATPTTAASGSSSSRRSPRTSTRARP